MMQKEFNDTGLCIPNRHYMVDNSDKLKQIIAFVEKGKYFTINRPRQFGKTTSEAKVFVSTLGEITKTFASEPVFTRQTTKPAR
jgi:hypothetical protein